MEDRKLGNGLAHYVADTDASVSALPNTSLETSGARRQSLAVEYGTGAVVVVVVVVVVVDAASVVQDLSFRFPSSKGSEEMMVHHTALHEISLLE